MNNYRFDSLHCKQCSNKLSLIDIKRKKIFCNRSCSAIYNNKQKGIDIRKCPNCMNTFNTLKYKKNKYCSLICSSKHKQQLLIESNLKLLINGELKDNNRQRIKKALLAYGVSNQCSICNIIDWQDKPLPFILDHIDGNPYNNDVNNLRLLCSNCDSQTSNYKGKNKGYGRKLRTK